MSLASGAGVGLWVVGWGALGNCQRPSKGGGLFKSRTPTGCENFWGSGGGGGYVGRPVNCRGPLGGGGGRWVGTPTHIPQNDPHDALIILNTHNWGKNFFQKNLPFSSGSHQPRYDPEVRSGSICFLCFLPIFEFSKKF